jgi:hypothetical protein
MPRLLPPRLLPPDPARCPSPSPLPRRSDPARPPLWPRRVPTPSAGNPLLSPPGRPPRTCAPSFYKLRSPLLAGLVDRHLHLGFFVMVWYLTPPRPPHTFFPDPRSALCGLEADSAAGGVAGPCTFPCLPTSQNRA